MLGKIALEEGWSIPEAIAINDPGQFIASTGRDRLTNELLDVHDMRLRQMDENGVDFMVLSFTSAGCQGISDPAAAEALATLVNDRLSETVMKNPRRFAAFATLSMHNPSQAAAELTRVMTTKKGFVGVLLNDFQSAGADGNTMLFYDQPEYDPFWKAVNNLKTAVYIHPRVSSPLIREHMWKGRPWLDFSALAFAHRVSMHVLGIITNGVLDRFPDVKLICGHMGEQM